MAVELRRKKNIYVSRNPTDPIFIVPTLIFLRFLSMLFLWSNDKLALKHCRIDKCVQWKKIADLPTLPLKPCFQERRFFLHLNKQTSLHFCGNESNDQRKSGTRRIWVVFLCIPQCSEANANQAQGGMHPGLPLDPPLTAEYPHRDICSLCDFNPLFRLYTRPSYIERCIDKT